MIKHIKEYTPTTDIVTIANNIVNKFDTRNPIKLANYLDITIIPCNFQKQRGAYKVLHKNRFIFLKNDLSEVMQSIVLLHEIGHDQLHRNTAKEIGGIREFNIFDMKDNRMEYEANLFAAQVSIPDDEILDYIEKGYDIQQIAMAMYSDINLIALKVDTLISQGYRLRHQEHRNDFLNYKR